MGTNTFWRPDWQVTLWRLEYHAKELGIYPEGGKEPRKALEQQKDTITSVLRKMNLSSGRRWAGTKGSGGRETR